MSAKGTPTDAFEPRKEITAADLARYNEKAENFWMSPETYVIASLQYEATHRWRDMPKDPELDPVRFLGHPHRHIFHIKVWKNVAHENREVEIILLKRQIARFLEEEFGGDFGGMSCEMIANKLMQKFELSLCEVLEDGENGAAVINFPYPTLL